MDISMLLIDSMLEKFISEKKWVYQAIDQLSEEDVVWHPTPESNSIANLISHIRGTVRQRLETVFFNVPDQRDRDKEFKRGLQVSKEEALTLANESFDVIIQILEDMKLKPQLLMWQPYLNMPTLTFSANDNESTLLDMMVQMVREVHNHTGQIMYIAKMRKGQLQWVY
ncbi:DUF1572 family protein [Heyndrickxia oleronia]|uniref:DUF1572 family protein n=1 Tax=Heyndrickxia oleronia TaxID=38875 RepID=UPI00203B283C|nr:DUF1572 family protein [Heyndrickxia oleronia]MCI1745945.1 DUF1572 domain-containing protein [Heyndrickxia oleronia]MCI1763531.1 DUF1572 domain-containing protein [Heyndrickxia oleronia]MCM3456780.1 DUF1572 domain-containing protein [Heyndrickxia oleronia]